MLFIEVNEKARGKETYTHSIAIFTGDVINLSRFRLARTLFECPITMKSIHSL